MNILEAGLEGKYFKKTWVDRSCVCSLSRGTPLSFLARSFGSTNTWIVYVVPEAFDILGLFVESWIERAQCRNLDSAIWKTRDVRIDEMVEVPYQIHGVLTSMWIESGIARLVNPTPVVSEAFSLMRLSILLHPNLDLETESY